MKANLECILSLHCEEGVAASSSSLLNDGLSLPPLLLGASGEELPMIPEAPASGHFQILLLEVERGGHVSSYRRK